MFSLYSIVYDESIAPPPTPICREPFAAMYRNAFPHRGVASLTMEPPPAIGYKFPPGSRRSSQDCVGRFPLSARIHQDKTGEAHVHAPRLECARLESDGVAVAGPAAHGSVCDGAGAGR